MRKYPRGHPDGDTLGAEHQQQWQLAGKYDRLLVAAIVARHEIRDLIIKHFIPRQFGKAALDISWRSGRIAGEDISVITLSFDQVTLVGQDDESIPNRGIAMRMILHRMPDDVCHFDEPPVILLVQCPQDPSLDR